MEKLYHKLTQLPSEQLKCLMSYKKLFDKPLCCDYSFIIELIERKAFHKGFIDLVIVLNTNGIEKHLLNLIDEIMFSKDDVEIDHNQLIT